MTDEPAPIFQQMDHYFLWLGRMISRFAEVEANLRLQCAVNSEMPVELTGVVFGSLTVSTAIETLKRLRKAKARADDPDLARVLEQLKIIAEARNAILHRGVHFHEGGVKTAPGLPNSRMQQRAVDPDMVQAMALDLQAINAALVLATPFPPEAEPIIQAFRAQARVAWGYKP
jgi:hypothetical protein